MIQIFFTFLLLVGGVLGLAQTSYANSPIETAAKQAIVVDYETGTILLSKNEHERMPTSSMSKTMTIYMVFDALEKGQVALDTTFTVSEKAWRKEGSKMFVEVDKQVKVEDLIRGVVVQSGNDATIVLAEGLAGSEEVFASNATQKAKQLGMLKTNFVNASGWPDPNHYSTAYDLAILGIATIRDFPEYYPYYAEQEFTYNNITQRNRNPLLYRNIGADGIKTGHTEIAGYGLIGSGTDGKRRIVLVINGLEDERGRAQESAKLMEWGLRNFENKTIYKQGQTIDTLPVVMGEEKNIGAVAARDITATLPKNAIKTDGSLDNISMSVRYKDPLVAPIAQGDEIGTLEIEVHGQNKRVIPLIASKNIAEQGVIGKTLTRAGIVFGNMISGGKK